MKKDYTKKELIEDELEYVNILSDITDSYYRCDVDGNILQISDSIEKILGFNKGELIGKNIAKIFTNPKEFEVFFDRIKNKKNVKKYPIKFIKKDKENIFVETNSRIFYDKIGNYAGFEGIFNDITKYKKAIQFLKESESNLRSHFNAMTDGVFEIDYNGRYLYIAPTSIEFSYKSYNEILDKNLHEVLPKIEADKLLKSIRKSIDENKTIIVEYPMIIDGQIIWFEGRIIPKAENSTLFIARDITEHKISIEKLRESEFNLRSLFNAMTDSVFEIDYDGKYLYIAPTSPDMLYKSSENMVGKTLHEIFPKTEADKYLEFIHKSLDENKSISIEYSMIIDGKTIWFEGRATPKTKNSVMYIARDITNRKQTEEQLKESYQKLETSEQQLVASNQQLLAGEQQLRASNKQLEVNNQQIIASEKKYKTTIKKLPVATIILDSNSKILSTNSEFKKIFNFNLDEIIGKNIIESLSFINDVKFRNSVKTLVEKNDKFDFESDEITTPVGNKIYLRCRGVLIGGFYKKEKSFLIVMGNITERKLAEIELANYRKHLEKLVAERTKKIKDIQNELIKKERLSVLGQLSGGIGHELRNPLGIISNSIYFLNMKLKEKEKDEKIKKHFSLLNGEIKRSDKLITELLNFSEEKTLYITKINVNSLIRDTIEEMKIPKHILLGMNFDDKLPKINLDPVQIERVIQHLVYNAIDAITENGKLTIVTKKSDNSVIIKFIDNGNGIPKENMQKIFEPLFTTKTKGIGLGLSIVKDIIDSHKGIIEVDSEFEMGTTVTIKLEI